MLDINEKENIHYHYSHHLVWQLPVMVLLQSDESCQLIPLTCNSNHASGGIAGSKKQIEFKWQKVKIWIINNNITKKIIKLKKSQLPYSKIEL